MALKLKREVVVRSKFLTRKDSLTGEIISVIAPNGLQVGLSGSNSVSAEFNSYGKSKFYEGLSGSLTQLTDGTSYLIAGSNVTIASASNGAVTISSTGGGGSGSPGGSNTQVQFNDGGSFGGDAGFAYNKTTDTVTVAGAVTASLGLSGSLTKLVDGTSYLIAGSNVTISSTSNGPVTISSTQVSPAGSDTQFQYNDGGSFGGAADLTFNDSTGDVTVGASTGDAKLFFRDSGIFVNSPADGNLAVEADGKVLILSGGAAASNDEAAASDVKVYFSGSLDGSNKVLFGGDIMVSGTVNVTTDEATPTVARFESLSTETTFGPIFVLDREEKANVADGMGSGLINFQGQTDTGAGVGYARISAEASDVSDGAAKGKLILRVQQSVTTTEPNAVEEIMSLDGGNASTGPSVVINDLSYDVDFRVESNDETHMLFVDGGNNRVSIGDSTDAPAATLEVTNHASAGATGVPLLQLNSNDTDEIALDINAANIDADVIDIAADAVTTAFVMDVTADGLTTGGILNLVSDSSDGSNQRSLVKIHNDNTAAVQVTSLNITNDAAGTRQDVLISTATTTGDVFDINCDSLTTGNTIDVSADGLTTGGILNLVSDSSDTSDRTLVKVTNDNTGATGTTVMHLKSDAVTDDNPILLIESSAADTGPVLELRNTNAGTNREAILRFTRSDSSAEADDMDIGRLQFEAVDSGNNDTIYVAILAEASDVTSGDEGGLLKFRLFSGGTGGTAASNTLFSIGGEDVANSTPCEVVVNEDGIDCNFRAESDNNTHMLYVDAGDDTVTVGADDSLHKDGFAVINDYQSTTFENKLADGEFGSAEILKYSPGANDTLTAGQLFFLNADGTWDQTDADAVATGASQLLGVGLGGSSRTVGCLIRGFIKIPSTEILNKPGSVDGKPLYVSTTAGHFDFNAPSASSDFVRIVGYAIDDDSNDVLVYFNPDGTFVEIA